MNNYFKFLAISLLLVIIGSSLWLGGGIPFSEQMPIYDGLRTTSAIIFAVMGAWIALLYPSTLSKAFGKKPFEEKSDDIEQINRLFKPMLYSTGVLITVIGVAFIVPLAKQIEFLHLYKEFFRAISFSVIGALTYIQFWSLILSLIPSDSIKDDLDGINKRNEMIERMKPGNKK